MPLALKCSSIWGAAIAKTDASRKGARSISVEGRAAGANRSGPPFFLGATGVGSEPRFAIFFGGLHRTSSGASGGGPSGPPVQAACHFAISRVRVCMRAYACE